MKPSEEHKKINQHPFQVPDQYFDTLSTEIINRKNESKSSNVPAFTPALRWTLMSAFAVLLVSLSIIFFNQEQTPRDYLAEVSTEDILLYLESQSISEEELIEEFGTDLLSQPDEFLDEGIQLDEDILNQYDYEINIELKQEI